ncbi:SSPO protein, partial [Polypterus senegalus]
MTVGFSWFLSPCSCDSGGDCECLCTAIATYTEECNKRGVSIRWRTQDLCRCHLECGRGEFHCSVGRCISYMQRCDGHDDCGDLSDEHKCVCPSGQFQCPNQTCLRPEQVCDGQSDCNSGMDEEVCHTSAAVTCASGQLACGDGTCITREKTCDGVTDCPDGADENDVHCSAPITVLPGHTEATPPPGSTPSNETTGNCSAHEFLCGNGECKPKAWLCDGETDCGDGSDEVSCYQLCGPDEYQCHGSGECIHHIQLCDGKPDCRDQSDESLDNCGSTQIPPCPGKFPCNNRVCVNTSQVCNGIPECPLGEDELQCGKNISTSPCPEFTCNDGSCISFNQVCDGVAECSDQTGVPPLDEHDCGVWHPWESWGPCSRTCGAGFQKRQRHCSSQELLKRCRGEAVERQQCFNVACPVDGGWSQWTVWSNCTKDCSGVVIRRRECIAPQNGGSSCTSLPGSSQGSLEIGFISINPITKELLFSTEPCPQNSCQNVTLCPGGLVARKCASCPLTCADLAKDVSCGIDCFSVNCGWSSWSPWGECLGPCGVQSVQWSFRSPNNPSKHGGGRQCRGIYRKAQRCQTEPCEDCEFHGERHAIGERWKFKNCQVCQCLPNLTVQCSDYCPYTATGCAQGHTLVPGNGETCCYCEDRGTNATWLASPTPPSPFVTTSSQVTVNQSEPLVPMYPVSPGDECLKPIGVENLPDSSFSASSQQRNNPAKAGRLNHISSYSDLQGWSPDPEQYRNLQENPAFLQIDLLQPHNVTGVIVQGPGASDSYVSSFYLQLSLDGHRWFTFQELLTDGRPHDKLFLGNTNDSGVTISHLHLMVTARFVRIVPHNFYNGIYLRTELLGCGEGIVTQGSTHSNSMALRYRLEYSLDGVNFQNYTEGNEQPDHPQMLEAQVSSIIPTTSMLHRIIFARFLRIMPVEYKRNFFLRVEILGCSLGKPTGEPGISQEPGIHGTPAVEGTRTTSRLTTAKIYPRTTGQPGIPHMEGITGSPGVHLQSRVTFAPGADLTMESMPPLPRMLCAQDEFQCRAFGCVDAVLVCDGQRDCMDGSDEQHCGTVSPSRLTPGFTTPGQITTPSGVCSPKQFMCGSGECIHQDRKCDLQGDCQDRSDEKDCVDCIVSAWTEWSSCSQSCGLGSIFRQREVIKEEQDGGQCEKNLFDSRACFIKACPVAGQWSEWGPWSACDVTCGNGVRSRERSCSNPPPKNGGEDCDGDAFDTESCNLPPCNHTAAAVSKCPSGLVFISAEDCEEESLNLCPLSCEDLNTEFNCSLQCKEDVLAKEKQWTEWTSWSQCSKTCFVHVDSVGVRRRFRACNESLGNACSGPNEEQELCATVPCPVHGAWSQWSHWSNCTAECNFGVQTRSRACTAPAPRHGGDKCPGPHVQTRDCNTQPCHSACPEGMVYHSKETCQQAGGACPRVCMDLTAIVECATDCYDGCYCPDGFYLQNETCVPLSQCYCYHQGKAYPPGVILPWNACNNCTCLQGRMICGTAPCPDNRTSCPPDKEWKECASGYVTCTDVSLDVLNLTCEPGCFCREGTLLQGATAVVESFWTKMAQLVWRKRIAPALTSTPWSDTFLEKPSQDLMAVTTVSGGWCEWSAWTPCSRTCGSEMVTRYRTCSCPAPLNGGSACEGVQEYHVNLGVQIERKQCPSVSFCPVHGAWSSWSPWSLCDGCLGASVRTRECSSPPARFGGLPCQGEARQSRVCHDNETICSECGGGQVDFPCGKPCPRTCDDLQSDTVCEDSTVCQPSCGCPGQQVLQDGICVDPSLCRCKYQNITTDGSGVGNGSWVWPESIVWMYSEPGETIYTACQNCTCEEGHLYCQSDPRCRLDGNWSPWSKWSPCTLTCGVGTKFRYRDCSNPAPQGGGRGCLGDAEQQRSCNAFPCEDSESWGEWSAWTECTVTCGGGEQIRRRTCRYSECKGLTQQSKACNTHVCLDVGCPPDRLYRECQQGEGCPYSCAHVSLKMSCYSDSCEEGCHCPVGTFFHNHSCVTVCPCDVDQELLQKLRNLSSIPSFSPVLLTSQGNALVLGDMVQSGDSLFFTCGSCVCQHSHWNCSLSRCSEEPGVTSWGPWGSCSRTCGGLGHMTRFRECIQEEAAQGNSNCTAPLQDVKYCQAPDCPDTLDGFGPWTSWSPCSKSCTDTKDPALKIRTRNCVSHENCTGETSQEMVCNLPQCSGTEYCQGEDCAHRNCSWNPWSSWGECSRSCGVGQQQRLRTFVSPGINGSWCDDIMGGNVETQFCNIRACRGYLEQDGSCVQPWQCECMDALGQSWAPGSSRQEGCNNCTCINGHIQCTNLTCGPSDCGWSSWSTWSSCSVSCGVGQRTRFRSSTTEMKDEKCQTDQSQTKMCDLGVCPPLCIHKNQELMVGETWLVGECQQCICTPEGVYCQDIECQVDGDWTPWSLWSDCSVTCGRGVQIRSRACINPPPRNNGSDCSGPEQEAQDCGSKPCHEDSCPWSSWSPCSRSCGTGLRFRKRDCACTEDETGETVCPPERLTEETQPCYEQPCTGCPLSEWTEWSSCSCTSLLQQRYRTPVRSSHVGQDCDGIESQSKTCPPEDCTARAEVLQVLDHLPPIAPPGVAELRPRRAQEPLQRLLVATQDPNRAVENFISHRDLQGLLEQNATCVPPEHCGCLHLLHPENDGPPVAVTIPPGEMVVSGCKACHLLPIAPPGVAELRPRRAQEPLQYLLVVTPDPNRPVEKSISHGALRVSEAPRGVAAKWSGGVSFSEWSEWTACSPCLPRMAISPKTVALLGGQVNGDSNVTELLANSGHYVSVQRRYRTCLALETGLPVSSSDHQCPGDVEDERLCPDSTVCEVDCVASEWSEWSECSATCNGGVSVRNKTIIRHAEHGGEDCPIPLLLQRACNAHNCTPVDCLWSEWSPWTSCSVSCGTGSQSSSRVQIQQRMYSGRECEGSPQRSQLCTQPDCKCPRGQRFKRLTEDTAVCERTCQEIYELTPLNCSMPSNREGCVCEVGRYRNSTQDCVMAAHCECADGKNIYQAGAEWTEGCLTCHCVNGMKICKDDCPPVICVEGEVKVEEPGQCCPVCRKELPSEPLPVCQRYSEIRNITKGDCHLDNVEVTYCRGQCHSSTTVVFEEPYIDVLCECCSYKLDPENPVHFLSLQCDSGEVETVVLPVIQSCQCSRCHGLHEQLFIRHKVKPAVPKDSLKRHSTEGVQSSSQVTG